LKGALHGPLLLYSIVEFEPHCLEVND